MIGPYSKNVAIFCKSPLNLQIMKNHIRDNVRTWEGEYMEVSMFTDERRTRLIKIVSKEDMEKVIGPSNRLS